MNLNNHYYKLIVEHAEEFPHEEVCGTVELDQNLMVKVNREKNQSIDKEKMFSMSPLTVLKRKKLLGIYHSHPNTDENPSEYDIGMSEEMGIPFLIYSLITKKFFLYYPKSYKAESLSGRPYVTGFYECLGVAKDYFNEVAEIDVHDWNKNYWPGIRGNIDMIKRFEEHMTEITLEEMSKGDLIVFEIRNERTYHVGVYEGGDNFVHQRSQHLSGSQMLDERWRKRIKYVYRYIAEKV